MALPTSGPFAALFAPDAKRGRPYLALLDAADARETRRAIEMVRASLQHSGVGRWVERAMREWSWRVHLPVAIAHFLEEGRCLDPATLWAAVDDGSWVTPQLMAALRRSDPRLVERVVERLERLGEPDDGVGERLAALGKRPKYIASLLDTAAGLPALSTQVDAWRSRRVVAEGLEADERADRSGAISRQWEERVLRALAG